MITIIGLGVEKGDLTARGAECIRLAVQAGAKVLVRTAKTRSYQTVLDMDIPHSTLDYIYEKSRSFKTLAKNLAKAVADAGENAVYLVDGSASEDYSVKEILKRTRGKAQIIDGVSKVGALVSLARFKSCSYTAVSAYELFERADTLTLPLIVYDLDDRALASDCKLRLGNALGEEISAQFITGGKSKKIALYELDRQKIYDYSSAVAIERIDLLEKTRFSTDDLKEIITRLRAPDGCPWDRVQTNDSIKMAAVEEAYELVDAINQDDDDKILEETGDILMQAVFHAVLKEEMGAFDFNDVVSGVCHKLISRHTHVFGADKASDNESALSVWEKNKMQEKGQDTFAKAVNDVPSCFPAAMRAQKVGKRAAKAGMDFADVASATTRVKEELEEFFLAYQKGDAVEAEKELGDVLFAAVSVGRKAGCDCEKALKESVDRFAARFTKAEALALADGKIVTELSDAEWDEYYIQAKKVLQ